MFIKSIIELNGLYLPVSDRFLYPKEKNRSMNLKFNKKKQPIRRQPNKRPKLINLRQQTHLKSSLYLCPTHIDQRRNTSFPTFIIDGKINVFCHSFGVNDIPDIVTSILQSIE